MGDYSLQADETILYERDVTIQGQKRTSHLMLTNLNIVITDFVKRSVLAKEEKEFTTYPVEDIKIYEGKPQIIQKGKNVKILFLSQELDLVFDSIIEVKKFNMAATKLVTGKSASARGSEKVKNAINIIDDTLGIDTVGTAKTVLERGVVGSLVGGVGKKSRSGGSRSKAEKAIEAIGVVSEVVQKKSNNETKQAEVPELTDSTEKSHDEQIATLKKFKDLFDAGIITEEEFAEKKKEILGL